MLYNTIALLVSVTVVAVLYSVDVASAQQWCPLPPRFKQDFDFKWRLRTHEWSNNVTAPDFLLFVLSWTPTFCESLSASVRGQEFQCSSGDHFGLIVHGLWPQVSRASSVRDHPRNCRDENQLNTTMVKRYFCMIPDEDQIQSQWEKHGTCHYRSAAEYYATIEKLFQSLKLPQIQSMKNPTDASIKSALINLNSKLFSSAVRISMESTNRLKEIKICYNFALQPISCYT